MTAPARGLRDQLGIGAAVVVAAAGWALTAVALSDGTSLGYLAVHLVPGLPLALTGTLTALAAWKRRLNVALWLALMVVGAALVNLVVMWLIFRWDIWGQLVPPNPVWGMDFRDGLYTPGKAFSVATSGWPPLTLLVGRPFTLLPVQTAYGVQVVLIACAAVGSAVLSALLAVKVVARDVLAHRFGAGVVDAQSLGIVLCCWLVTSYGFMYELWRGNINLYALVFSLLAVWLAIRLPHSRWWPAMALALAINLKLYPAILLVLLFWRYRLRAVLPVVATNAVLLLIAGPANLRRMAEFVTANSPGSRHAVYGDMGAAGTAAVLRATTTWAPPWIAGPLLLVPVALWAATAWLVIRRGWSAGRAVLLAAASITPMAVIPTLSNDYKLVLFVLPLAVLAAALAGSRLERGGLAWCLGFGAVLWLTFFLARSSVFHGQGLIGSKYSLAVLVQMLLLLAAWKLDPGEAPASAAETKGAGRESDAAASTPAGS
jgi:hypothetical protein